VGVVTGASAGIGLAVAHELAGQGAAVVLNARRKEKLEELARALSARGGRAVCVAGDAASQHVIDAMLDAGAQLGAGKAPDIIVVNAGRGLSGSALTSDASQWEEMLRTNITGAALLIRAAGRRLLAEVEGQSGPAVLARPRDIVVLGSTVGRHISPFSSMYGATKFAVNSLAEASRRELGPRGVRVTLFEPGFVESEFQGVAGYDPAWFAEVKGRIGPVLSPADVARSVGFVVSQPAHVHVSDVLIRPTRQEYP
jgi:NADP-dependent 3-hydroxy acid dehydrogenase YdfG